MGSDQGEAVEVSGRSLLAAPPAVLAAVPGAGEVQLELELEGLPGWLQGRGMPVWGVGLAAPAVGIAGLGATLGEWAPRHSLIAAVLLLVWLLAVGSLARWSRRAVVRLSEHAVRVGGTVIPWATAQVQVLDRPDHGCTFVFVTPDGRYVWSARVPDPEARAWLREVMERLGAEARAGGREVPEALRTFAR